MSKKDLVAKISEELEVTKKDAVVYLDAIVETFTEILGKGESISLKGFGTLSVVEAKARTGRNPQTGEEIAIPAKNRVKFKASPNLKELVNS